MGSTIWIEFLPLGQAIGWTILNSLWQIGLLAALWKLILWFIPHRQPNFRYLFTLMILVLSTVWVGNTFLEEWRSVKSKVVDNQEVIVPVNARVLSGLTKVEVANGEGFSTPKNAIEAIGVSQEEGAFTQANLGKLVEVLNETLLPYLPFLAIVWYFGVLCFSVSIIGGFFHLYRLKTDGISLPDEAWISRFNALKKQMGIRKEVQFFISNNISTPLTFYFFKPIVLAPIGLFAGLSIKQIEVLLLHELAHIRRYDFTINIFQSLIEILFFYHPAVWWMSSELRKEREHCCDDLVMSIRNNPLLYAEALTCIQSPNFSLKTSLAMAATGKKGSFSQRIFRLFGQYDHQPVSFRGTLLILLLLFSGLVLQSFYQPFEEEILNTDTEESISMEEAIPPIAISETNEIVTKDHTNEHVISNPFKPLMEVLPIIRNRYLSKNSEISSKTDLARSTEEAIKEHFASLQKDFSVPEETTIEADLMEAVDNTESYSKNYELKDGDQVFIDWSIGENAEHIDASKFKRWSSKKIRRLYERNVKATLLAEKGKLQTEGSFQGVEEFDPLIYTIKSGSQSRLVKLRTHVNHQRKIVKGTSIKGVLARQKGKRALKNLKKNTPFSSSLSPVRGSLPEIVKLNNVSTYYTKDYDATSVSLTLSEKATSVIINILKVDGGTLEETLHDQPLKEGKHEFTWRHDGVKEKAAYGEYQLDIQVNGQTLSQLIEVNPNKQQQRRKRRNATSNCKALLEAVKANDLAEVKMLLLKADPDCTYRGGGEPRSPLVAAARKGNLEIGQLLLANNGSTEYHANGDETPLMAAAKNGHLDFVKMLVENGARVNKKVDGDGTALLVAAAGGHLSVVGYLIAQKADVNGQVGGDGTPLICAVRNGYYEVCELLLENGADPMLNSPGDENPIYHASTKRDRKYLDLLLEYRSK